MEATICGSTAYQYWRTPPIVKLLASGVEDDSLLHKYVSEAELTAFRVEAAESLSFVRSCAAEVRTQGSGLRAIREASPLLAVFSDGPVELLAQTPEERHTTKATRFSLWQSPLPVGALKQISYDLDATSPAFTLSQLASRVSLVRLVLLASECCGNYAIYRAPRPVAAILQRMIDRDRFPIVDGWRPCLGPGRKLGELWERPALVTVSELDDLAGAAEFQRGRKRLSDAAALVKPHSASPFETQAGVLLGFSRRRGGEGFGDFTFNEKVELTPDARILAQRRYCYCDLFWPDGLDVECQSIAFHANESSFLSDSDRTAALSLVGVEVLPLTFAQLSDEYRFAAFSLAVAQALGRPYRQKTPLQEKATKMLREELFVDWWKLPLL